MIEWLHALFATRGLAPHGYCLLWDPRLIWTHVISDAVIAAAYFSIPIVLSLFLARRRDIEFGWLVGLFALFIVACGSTHVLNIVTLWIPAYGAEALVKALTALASIGTAIALWPLLPRFIALPSPAQLQRANADLRREAEERLRVEDQLRQSQKMEAMGQLTGGIAHDFNNLLNVIMGNVDRALRHLPADAPVRQNLANALTAGERAGALTEKLLGFARRQPLEIAVMQVGPVIEDLRPLIERAVGERVIVELDIPGALPAVRIDRHGLESAILNLAINARDAMPAGGTLSIAIAANEDSVIVAVRDTGTGMDEETRRRATEPFFTTKPIGQGTGLGLSQVYGFIAQMGGGLEIESVAGEGTSITLSLPRV